MTAVQVAVAARGMDRPRRESVARDTSDTIDSPPCCANGPPDLSAPTGHTKRGGESANRRTVEPARQCGARNSRNQEVPDAISLLYRFGILFLDVTLVSS